MRHNQPPIRCDEGPDSQNTVRRILVTCNDFSMTMESMGEIIDLTTFRNNESQELSLADLLEQAEALVILQQAVLNQSGLTSSQGEPNHHVMTVANSLQHLRRHLGLIKRLIPQP